MRPVRAGRLEVQASTAIWQPEQADVAQRAPPVRRRRPRLVTDGVKGTIDAVACHSGGLVPVLVGVRPPVVEGEGARYDARDASAPLVPSTPTTGEHRPPDHPFQPIAARCVASLHAVLTTRVAQRVAAHPHVPRSGGVDVHDRVLERRPLVARKHRYAPLRLEPIRTVGVDRVDVPVQRARSGTAQIQPPAPVRKADDRGAFERVSADLMLVDARQPLEVNTVARAGDDHFVAATVPNRLAQPVAEVEPFIHPDGAGRPSPMARPDTLGADGDLRRLEAWQRDRRIGDGRDHGLDDTGPVPSSPDSGSRFRDVARTIKERDGLVRCNRPGGDVGAIGSRPGRVLVSC